jgi:hypothetical protein
LYAKRGIANATQNPDGTWNSDAADPTSHPYEAPPAATDFSKWTEDQKAMYAAGMGGTGLLTDALRAKGQFKDGSNVASYGAADQSASDADLKARAMSRPSPRRSRLISVRWPPPRHDKPSRQPASRTAAATMAGE